jgi:hypothetical protein
VKQLALLLLQASEDGVAAVDLLLTDADHVAHVVLDRLLDSALVGLGHRDRLVVLLDGSLDVA